MNLFSLIEYIKTNIELLIKNSNEKNILIEKQKKKIKIFNENKIAEDWESLLIKEEANIRKHISNEHQLKIHIEQMRERIEELELDNKVLLLKEEKHKNLEREINQYKSRIIILNKLIKSYQERELRLELENKVSKINSKEESNTAAPSLKEEDIIHSCSTINKISYSSKRVHSHKKDIKYKSPIFPQKLKSRKILKKAHILNSNSTINSKKNDSLSKTKNDEGKNTIDFDKHNNSNYFNKKNYGLYSFTIKNNVVKKRIKYSNNKKSESLTNSNINNSQLLEIKNIKLYDHLDMYKKILSQKISNISKKIKNKNNGFQSCRNNSELFLSKRDKDNYHSNSLENGFYSKKNKMLKYKVKRINIKVINGRNKYRISHKNENINLKKNIVNKNQGIFKHESSENFKIKSKTILINKRNGNILSKGNNDNSLRNFLFNKKDNNPRNKIYIYFNKNNKS